MILTRINEFEAVKGKEEELHNFLKSLVPYISSSAGCHSCEVLKNKDDNGKFVVVEKWDCIESHKKSIENFPKEEMQAAMSLFGVLPKGAYYIA